MKKTTKVSPIESGELKIIKVLSKKEILKREFTLLKRKNNKTVQIFKDLQVTLKLGK